MQVSIIHRRCEQYLQVNALIALNYNTYRLNALIARKLSEFTSTNSATKNEKFQYQAECGIENFKFIASERAQVNHE